MATSTRATRVTDLTVDDLLDSSDVLLAAGPGLARAAPKRRMGTSSTVDRLHRNLEHAGHAFLRAVELSRECRPGDDKRRPAVIAARGQAELAAKFLMEAAGISELRVDTDENIDG